MNDNETPTPGEPAPEQPAEPAGLGSTPPPTFPPPAAPWGGYWTPPPPPPGADGWYSPYGHAGSDNGGAGVPPYPPPYWAAGGPYQPDGGNRAARRARRRQAIAAGATAGLLAIAGIGVVVGHALWPAAASSRAAVSAPAGSGSSGSGSTLTPGSGSGSTLTPGGSGGYVYPGGGGSGFPFDPYGGSGSGSIGGGTNSSSSDSIASGGPSNSAAIAKSAAAGMVDIDTVIDDSSEEAAGTGMVLTSNGEVLTNNHVIDGATTIKVTDIGNGKTYSATVVGYDRTQDVAVLQLQGASGLKTVSLGNSSSVKTGEPVVGTGNAGGVGGTPSYAGGAVQGLNKSITATDEDGSNPEHLTGLIETNAGIEPGDSGGPLLNTKGQVVGMDTAALSTAQLQVATTSTSYAIPINEALSIAKAIESGHGSSLIHLGPTALLGVGIEPTSQTTSPYGEGYGSGGQATAGAAISQVLSGSGAAKAGLVAGDTITGIAGQKVSSAADLSNIMPTLKPGQTVKVTYVNSSGQQRTVSVTLGSGPPQ